MVETKTVRAIPRSEVPAGRKIAYHNPQVKSKVKEGVKTYKVRGTINGNKVEYPGAVSSNAAEMTTTKLLWKSTISTPRARFITLDICDFYLGT